MRTPLTTPCIRRTAESEGEAAPLDRTRAAAYRALAARANYLALDRPDLAFAAKECCRRMASPSTLDWAALVRLARYVAGNPRLTYDFPWQDEVWALGTWVDTDFAGCLTTRKSTSGGLTARGAHLLKHWSTTQKTIA